MSLVDDITAIDALDLYQEAGWARSFLMPPGAKDPPPGGVTGYRGTAPSASMLAGFRRMPHASMVATALPKDIIGIDVDQYDAKHGAENLARLEAELGPLPPTIRSTSRGPDNPSGIRLYRVPPGEHWKGEVCADVELISWHDRYAIVWPSIHPDRGTRYTWYDDADEPLACVPEPADDLPWLPWAWIAKLTKDPDEPADYEPPNPQRATESDWHPNVKAKLDEYPGTGSRHECARRVSMALARHEQLGSAGATSALETLGHRFIADTHADRGQGGAHGQRVAAAEWGRLVSGARTKARTTKSTVLEARNSQRTYLDDLKRAAEPPASDETPEPPPRPTAPGALKDGHRATDVGNADRLVAAADGRIRYVPAWGKWIVYRAGRWHRDDSEALVTEIAKLVPRTLFRCAAELDGTDRESVWKWAKRSETAGAISAMIRLARGIPGVLVDHDELDADPLLLNCQNGTVDLRTGELLPHDPEHLLTQQAPVSYDPNAEAPLWEACLATWQPDPTMRDYLQRIVGSAATGHPVEHLFINTGSGANGKSKFYGAIVRALGPYAVVPDKALFVTVRHEPHPTIRASLFRTRMLLAPETESGDRLAEAAIKSLVGGDPVTARRMHENEWKFWPTWTAFLHTNHRPNIRGTDDGIWRRVRLIPWDVTIPEDQRDGKLADKLTAEGPGILRWLVEGAVAYIAEGIDEPQQVATATAKYRGEEDHFGRFLDECCVVGDGRYVYASQLRDRYEAWCRDEGVEPLTSRMVGNRLRAVGVSKAPTGTHRWLRLGLVAEEHADVA